MLQNTPISPYGQTLPNRPSPVPQLDPRQSQMIFLLTQEKKSLEEKCKKLEVYYLSFTLFLYLWVLFQQSIQELLRIHEDLAQSHQELIDKVHHEFDEQGDSVWSISFYMKIPISVSFHQTFRKDVFHSQKCSCNCILILYQLSLILYHLFVWCLFCNLFS